MTWTDVAGHLGPTALATTLAWGGFAIAMIAIGVGMFITPRAGWPVGIIGVAVCLYAFIGIPTALHDGDRLDLTGEVVDAFSEVDGVVPASLAIDEGSRALTFSALDKANAHVVCKAAWPTPRSEAPTDGRTPTLSCSSSATASAR